MPACPLCDAPGGTVLIDQDCLRIIRADEPDYPGVCRVIWRDHVVEMSDLSVTNQQRVMHTVFAVERALRALYRPTKINLASLGNVVGHVHWHVIARLPQDRHFPQPVWAPPVRENCVWPEVSDSQLREAILQQLGAVSEPFNPPAA